VLESVVAAERDVVKASAMLIANKAPGHGGILHRCKVRGIDNVADWGHRPPHLKIEMWATQTL
jgi:hypothetical protein